MRETFRHIEHLVIICRELRPYPLLIGRRRWAQIDNDVINPAPGTAHQFGLFEWGRLVVHSPQGTLIDAERDIDLHELGYQALIAEFVLTPGPCKEPSAVTSLFELNDIRTV